MNGNKKRLQEIKSLAEHFGVGFALQCTVRRVISFSNYERYIYNYLDAFFAPVIESFNAEYDPDAVVENQYPNKVWTLWWQGEENAPEIVKVCMESQRKAFAAVGAEVIVLTKENWHQYIRLPQYILEKVENGQITLTHFSDIIRAELLTCYGGLWIDATVFCTKPVETDIMAHGPYTVKTSAASNYLTLQRWTGFLFGDEPNSKLFHFMADAFEYYWAKKNSLVAYLLIDYVIAIAYDHFSTVKEGIDRIPVSNTKIWDMLTRLNERYDAAAWQQIVQNTTFLKLSYKEEFNGGKLVQVDKEGELTYWGNILQNYSPQIGDAIHE